MIAEVGQSQASANAMARWERAREKSSEARQEVTGLKRQLRLAQQELKSALAAESAAESDYLQTPWACTP